MKPMVNNSLIFQSCVFTPQGIIIICLCLFSFLLYAERHTTGGLIPRKRNEVKGSIRDTHGSWCVELTETDEEKKKSAEGIRQLSQELDVKSLEINSSSNTLTFSLTRDIFKKSLLIVAISKYQKKKESRQFFPFFSFNSHREYTKKSKEVHLFSFTFLFSLLYRFYFIKPLSSNIKCLFISIDD
jgi:hypothetical protein